MRAGADSTTDRGCVLGRVLREVPGDLLTAQSVGVVEVSATVDHGAYVRLLVVKVPDVAHVRSWRQTDIAAQYYRSTVRSMS